MYQWYPIYLSDIRYVMTYYDLMFEPYRPHPHPIKSMIWSLQYMDHTYMDPRPVSTGPWVPLAPESIFGKITQALIDPARYLSPFLKTC